MLGLAEVKDWIKSLGIGENFYIGKMDNKKDKSIGIYQRKAEGEPFTAIGGLECTKTDTKQISILIHWSKNAKETEEAAYSLYNKLRETGKTTINGIQIDYIKLEVPEPIDTGTDDKGIYERVIWFNLIYER